MPYDIVCPHCKGAIRLGHQTGAASLVASKVPDPAPTKVEPATEPTPDAREKTLIESLVDGE